MDYPVKEAIILAGGFGTRLQSLVKDIPKPMAPVGDKPFLEYLLKFCKKNQIEKIILAVGYKSEVIRSYFGNTYTGMDLLYAEETEPLGTGGGIMNALQFAQSETVLILNGDSFFGLNIADFARSHAECKADISLALKPMKDFDRYGSVDIEGMRITRFNEKEKRDEGLINAGVYLINKPFLMNSGLPKVFSFEKDVLEKRLQDSRIYAYISDAYFMDIGIPEDYNKIQNDLSFIQ